MAGKSKQTILSDLDPHLTFGGRLRKSRLAAGLSINMSAHLAGVKPSTLSNWETDRSEPRANKLVALAGIFGVSPAYLLAETGQSENPGAKIRGRQPRLLAMLQSELDDLNRQQRDMAKALGRLNRLVAKLK